MKTHGKRTVTNVVIVYHHINSELATLSHKIICTVLAVLFIVHVGLIRNQVRGCSIRNVFEYLDRHRIVSLRTYVAIDVPCLNQEVNLIVHQNVSRQARTGCITLERLYHVRSRDHIKPVPADAFTIHKDRQLIISRHSCGVSCN